MCGHLDSSSFSAYNTRPGEARLGTGRGGTEEEERVGVEGTIPKSSDPGKASDSTELRGEG